jgi:hypothetical protein
VKRPMWVLVAAMTLAALFSGGSAAGDEEDRGAFAEGLCSADSRYTFGMVPEVGLALEVEIETEAPGENWRIKMIFNDGFFIVKAAASADEEGEIKVRKVVGNNDQVDRLEVLAVNLDTGEECRGAVQALL